MPDFEFEFNQQDKDLIVNQSAGEFGNNDYMRLTIYPSETINQVVTLQDNTKGIDGKAIFFSTLFEGPFSINVSPFTNDNSLSYFLLYSSLFIMSDILFFIIGCFSSLNNSCLNSFRFNFTAF